MKVVVTGGSGFIGSHLCDSLVELGHDVVCVDNLFTSSKANVLHLLGNPRFEFLRHDVCDPWHIECDRIYHLACPASPVHYQRNPVRTIKTATIGTLNALECARDTGARLLITSTSEVYGDPSVHPQPETYWGHVNPTGIRACYDEGKRVGESLATSWAQQYGTDVRIARLFNTYGPRMAFEDGRLIPNFMLQAMRGEPMTVYGSGGQTRSFCFVSDTVEALLRLMEVEITVERRAAFSPHPIPVVNVGNPDERSILSVAEDVATAILDLDSGRPYDSPRSAATVEFRPLPQDDPRQRCPDISRARAMLDWNPKVGYVEGIRTTAQWFKGNFKK